MRVDSGESQEGGNDSEAVILGRDALREAGNLPWYDRNADDMRSMQGLQDGSPGAGHRDSKWVARERQPRQANPGQTGMRSNGISNVILNALVWGAIAIILVGLIAFLVWAFMRHETAQDQDDLDDWLDDPRSDEQRIEDLPFEIRRPRSDLFAAAERARQQGDRRLAMIYLFSHMLVQMDRNHRIRLAKGKTNRQYLGEIVSFRRLHSIVSEAMFAFERVFFGDHDLDEEEFEAVWSSIGPFEADVKPAR